MYYSLKRKLRKQAIEKYKNILPVLGRKYFKDCFTEEIFKDGLNLVFWFNTLDKDTHTLHCKV